MARPRPQLVTGKLEKLHPAQLTVGMAEVAAKRDAWTKLKRKERAAVLDKHGYLPGWVGPIEN